MGRKTPVYLVEKFTGLVDENGVELFYAIGGRLTRERAERDFEDQLHAGTVRIRKIIAIK
jgi:hypothetical protein